MVPQPRSSLADQMQAELAAVRPGPVLPEVHGLPGAEQEAPLLKAQAQAGGREGGADVGWHVVGAFVVMAPGPQLALATQGSHPRRRYQGPQEGGQVLQHPGISVFVDGEAAAGMQGNQVGQAVVQAAGADLLVEGVGEVGESLAAGLQAEGMKTLAQHSGDGS